VKKTYCALLENPSNSLVADTRREARLGVASTWSCLSLHCYENRTTEVWQFVIICVENWGPKEVKIVQRKETL